MKRLLWSLFVFVVALGAYWYLFEQPPVCRGTDLFAKMKSEHPRRYDAILAQARKIPNGEALFWRIERDGTKPSYLLGTAHVTDSRITKLPDITRKALLGAAVLALEHEEIADKQKLTDALSGFRKSLELPSGETLWDLIPDSKEPLIRNHINMSPEIIKRISSYKPWRVTSILDEFPCEVAHRDAGIPFFDEALAHLAAKTGIAIVGLETIEEFFERVDSMSYELQIEELLNAAESRTNAADAHETLVNLYNQRLVTAFYPLFDGFGPPEELDMKLTALMDDELSERNRTMMRRAARYLAQGNIFIAVGALHLPGKEGLVELLRQAGYKLTPIN